MWKNNNRGVKEKITAVSKDTIMQLFKNHGITLENNIGYDPVFVYHMAKADFFGSSLNDEKSLLTYVKDYVDDPDGYDGLPMTRFYADCIGSGTPIM